MSRIHSSRTSRLATSTALGLVIGALLAPAPAALAQSGAPAGGVSAGDVDEVVVTARRRNEQAIDVPVVISAFTGEQLEKAGVHNLADLSRLTPQLAVDPNVAGFGGTVTLRGVISPTGTVSAEPATTTNIDGAPLSFGSTTQLGQLDLSQVEVLKGPQALFFGKNASGGIIALKTADPTADFETMVRAEYEAHAQEAAVEGVVSGPLSEALLGRLAIRYSDQRGYLKNDVPGVADRWGPGTEELAARATLLYAPGDDLTVRLKASYNQLSDIGSYFVGQRTYCQLGVPQGPAASSSITDCRADDHTARPDLPPGIRQVTGNPLFRDGVPYREVEAALGVLDVNYQLSENVALNSITSAFWLEQETADGLSRGVVALQSAAIGDKKRSWTQELRLSSTGTSRLTWMVGGFFQDDHLTDREQVVIFTPPSAFTAIPMSIFLIDTTVYSGFGQASFNLTDQLIVSGGLRYTHERKKQSVNISPKFLPEATFDNTSPEVTLSYRPTPNMNAFVSYKEGYKSGSFQVSSTAFRGAAANPALSVVDNLFREETVKGFEGGVKAALFDRRLRLNAAAYRYEYDDLQVSTFDPVAIAVRVRNAAASLVRGVEFDAAYAPAEVPGLRLFGALSYNKATYRDFVADCYIGQTQAEGCLIDGPDAGTVPDQQDLSGRVLPRAPRWSGNLGFNYERDVGDDLVFALNGQALWQTKSYLSQETSPGGIRPEKVLFDASASIGSRSGSWELALIGKNLTREYYGVLGSQVSNTGSAATTGTTGPGLRADYSPQVNRGREIWLRLTVRPSEFLGGAR